MSNDIKFGVLGGGSWATAIVKMLTENQDKVGWYMRNSDAVNYIVLIFAIPSAFLEGELQKITSSLKDVIVFSAIKGIVPETGLIVGEHFHYNYNIPFENIGVITGPCHAEEVALERLSYLTIASADKENAQLVADNLKSHYIKTKISDDIIGTDH